MMMMMVGMVWIVFMGLNMMNDDNGDLPFLCFFLPASGAQVEDL